MHSGCLSLLCEVSFWKRYQCWIYKNKWLILFRVHYVAICNLHYVTKIIYWLCEKTEITILTQSPRAQESKERILPQNNQLVYLVLLLLNVSMYRILSIKHEGMYWWFLSSLVSTRLQFLDSRTCSNHYLMAAKTVLYGCKLLLQKKLILTQKMD